MCGAGKRVKKHFDKPKPLINIGQISIIEKCLETLNIEGNYIFIIRKYDEFVNHEKLDFELRSILMKYTTSDNIYYHFVKSAVDSILCAETKINNSNPLMVVNCDQIFNWSSCDFFNYVKSLDLDACVTTYNFPNIIENSLSPYSFIKTVNNYAVAFEEKFAISKNALNGIFYWKKGSDFIECAKQMISENNLVNGEFYISRSLNYLIDCGKKISYYEMKQDQYISLGTTEEIKSYLENLEYNQKISNNLA